MYRGEIREFDTDTGSSELDDFVIHRRSRLRAAIPFQFKVAILEVLDFPEPDIKPFPVPFIKRAVFLNIANVHTIGVDFLHILETMGVEARIYQHNRSSHFFIYAIK